MKDHLGNVRESFKSSNYAAVNEKNFYYPFGLTVRLTTPGDPNKYLYNPDKKYIGTGSKELEVGAKQKSWFFDGYHGVYPDKRSIIGSARFYDPALGRWHTMDPADEFNSPYCYVGNNPIFFIDPDGMNSEPKLYELPAINIIADSYCAFENWWWFINQSPIDRYLLTKIQSPIAADALKISSMMTETTLRALDVVDIPITLMEISKGEMTMQEAGVAGLFMICPFVSGGMKKPATEIVEAGGNVFTKSNLQLGQKMHKAYKADIANKTDMIKEFYLPSGKRIDFLDLNNATIYELKPYNPRGINQGTKQLFEYKNELESMGEYKGIEFKIILEFY